ncbi:MAG: integrase [Thermoanaerobaculum sp.]|nr:MAG: integrase [Thermoanaerobaculum sp.]
MRVKITDRLLERKDLPRFVFDTELTGFGVEVLRSGKRAFFVQYGPRNRRRRFSFGVWPVFNAGAARQKAKELLLAVAQGKDPVRERQEERQSQELTFADWVRHYLVEVTQRKKQPRHDRCYLPRAAKILGTLPLVALTPGDIARALQTILKEAAKHPAASGPVPGATTANRFLASVRACLAVAKRRGLIPTNPAEAVEPLPEPPPRARVLTDSELARLGEVLATWPNPIERAAITLLMETGARSSELLRARWEDVDLEAEPPYWRIPSPKAGTPQVVPLTPRACQVLRELPRLGEYIIPGLWPDRPRASLLPAWRKICATAGIAGATLHDIRRTFGLHVAARAGIFAASKLLRHSDPRITARVYAPLGLADLAATLAKTGTPGDVLTFQRKKHR